MDRRLFLGAVGSVFGADRIPVWAAGEKPYGSSSFGEWVEDACGLPAFAYTCDQTKDPRAVTSLKPGILSATDHVHQVGNDRVVALASNYGHVQVRQDEGSPKLLNFHSPEQNQFGGGIGYLTGGGETLCTYYPGGAQSFERTFGMGYFRKKVSSGRYTVDQTITAPFGDDPVLLSQVTITNRSTAEAHLRWVEYWGCQVFQFSFRSFMTASAGQGPAFEQRKRFGARFTHRFEKLDAGLRESKEFQGYDPADVSAFERMKSRLAKVRDPFFGPVQECGPGASFDDLNPPPVFLVSLDEAPDGVSANGGKFFGKGGPLKPDGLGAKLDGELNAPGTESGLLLERAFTLPPGGQRTLYFLYGYLPAGVELAPLVARYRSRCKSVWKESCAQWKSKGMRFSPAEKPWIAREVMWNYYYVRGGLTYDSYFGEHIPSQGSIYQYQMGFQGAARDPLQHALPFLFSDPALLKETLRYTLKEVRPDGSIPYSIVGNGMIMPALSDTSSDMPLWLLWVASEYVLATRDMAFLDERIPARVVPGGGEESVRKLLARCFRHLVDRVGVGEHGVMRMLEDDWNDGLVATWALRAGAECAAKGESVLNAAMASWVLDYYAQLLACAGEDPVEVRRVAEQHRKSAREQWMGRWLRRAWLGPTLGWVGETGLWLEPQPWAILGGVTSPEQTREVVKAMDEILRRPSPIGAMQLSRSKDMAAASFEGGTIVNGGIWPSLNQTLVWALAGVDPEMAWDEWQKNTLARHAEAYPDIWYGVWSGPDTYNSVLSKTPGHTVNAQYLPYTDFPVFNLHSHACMLYSLTKLLGIEFTPEGLRLKPVLPLKEYRFESPLVGIIRTANGYEGWYEPLKPGSWTIQLELPGRSVQKFKGTSAPGKPLRWSSKEVK